MANKIKLKMILLVTLITLNLFAQDTVKKIPHFQNISGVNNTDSTNKCLENKAPSILSVPGFSLTKSINDALGVSPFFCRDVKVSTDDDNDNVLKNHINELASRKQKSGSKEKIEDTTYNVLENVVMKRLWGMNSEKNKINLFLSDSCKNKMLNKLPFINTKKTTSKSDPKASKQAYNDFIKLCSNDLGFDQLAPYLSKDVIAESMYILSLIYPNNFLAVKEFTCKSFKNTPEVIFKEEKYENFFLGSTDISNQQEYATWIKNTFAFGSNEVEEKISTLFQQQGRTKKASDILTKKEIASIQNYTIIGYDQINRCLRTSNCDPKTLNDCKNITSALLKLKNASSIKGQNVLYRGTINVPDFVIDNVEKASINGGTIVLDKGFLSTSGNEYIAKSFAKKSSTDSFVYVLKSKSCVGIADISKLREDEFLCPAGMKFKVEKSDTDNIYILQEIEK